MKKTKKIIEAGVLDKLIASISPKWALERHKSRVAMASMGGSGYLSGPYRESLAMWSPFNGDSDADTLVDRRELIASSRDLVRNSPIAAGAIETKVTYVVGTGLTLQSRVDAKTLGLDDDTASEWQSETERKFKLWADSKFCDAYRQQSFYEQQALAYRSAEESGDSFILLTNTKQEGWPFGLSLQVIESDRISNPSYASDTNNMTAGIEKNELGQPVAIHIANRHPGRYISAQNVKWTRVPIRGDKSGRLNVIHIMQKMRPGQTRGIPCLAPIIETIKQLSKYSYAEVDKAVSNASISMFTKMDPDAFNDLFDDSARDAYLSSAASWDGNLKSNTVINLLPGEEITTPVQHTPNPNFDAFIQSVMKQVGIGLNIPYEVLSKHFQSSYSAARAALLDAWRKFKIDRDRHASNVCQPIYEEWLADAVASGQIQAAGFFADPFIRAAWCGSNWSGDGPGSIDPMKEASAAGERMKLGLTTLQEEIIANDGGDWEQKHKVQKRVKQERVEAGLEEAIVNPAPVQQPGIPVQQPGIPNMPTDPENDSTDNETED